MAEASVAVPRRGRLLALEGIDGCGKSTQARALATSLGAHLTHEPGATPVGAQLRELLLSRESDLSERTEALLMAADRAEHVARVIVPALGAGQWVVTDRFSASTIAYQGYGRGLDLDELGALVAWAAQGLVPDLSILVDVPVEEAAARLARVGGSAAAGGDRLERLGPEFAARVREGFVAQAEAEPDRWLVVDGTAEAAVIAAHIDAAVRARFPDAPTPGP